MFSSSQFLGAFAGGVFGGWFLSSGDPGDVFFVAALVVGAWLVIHLTGVGAEKPVRQPEI